MNIVFLVYINYVFKTKERVVLCYLFWMRVSAKTCVCFSARGVIHIDNSSLGIEPLEGSANNEHLVYRLEDVKAESLSCGTPHSDHHDNQASSEHPEDSHAHDIKPGRPVSHLIRVSVRERH